MAANTPKKLTRTLRPTLRIACAAYAVCIGLAAPQVRADETAEADDALAQRLLGLSLSDLFEVEIVSVAKKSQKLSDSAAAVYVIGSEDIRRSGAANIAELLRQVPGIQVSRYNAHAWAISARGFSGFFTDKLLVLMDGRSIYNTEFSGVYWDTADVVLDDIERIEVIRGPGGTLWGANAVNGVINIITKDAHKTQGHLYSINAGAEQSAVNLRYGGAAGKTDYRVYAKASQYDDQFSPDAKPDAWHMGTAGFRADARPTDAISWTAQGEAFTGKEDEGAMMGFALPPTEIHGTNLSLRREQKLGDNSEWIAQFYYDHNQREAASIQITNHIFDFDVQHRLPLGDTHELMWGVGYRLRDNRSTYLMPGSYYDPEQRTDQLFSAFVQDNITLMPKELSLTAGAKVERNDYTGIEIQPNLRLAWTPADSTYMLWGAVSRASRTPSRVESDIFIEIPLPEAQNPFAPMPAFIQGRGNKDLDAEIVTAYEMGFRNQFNEDLALDLALFYNDYDKLRGSPLSIVPDLANGRILLQSEAQNLLQGRTYGAELMIDWAVRDDWKVQLSYSYLNMTLDSPEGSPLSEEDLENRTPDHQISLRSQMNLGNDWELDAALRYVDALASSEIGHVDAYTELDLRLSWHFSKGVEISLAGQNLLNEHHAEFGPENNNPLYTEAERRILGQIRWRF